MAPVPDENLDGPADGRSPNHWRNFVRGGQGESQRGNASIPTLSAVPESSVEDVGHLKR